jgi:hypothetical protein
MLEIWSGVVEQAGAEEAPVYGVFDEEAQCMAFFSKPEVDATVARHGYEAHGDEWADALVHRYHELYDKKSDALYELDYSLLLDRTFIRELEVEVVTHEPTEQRTLH